ncbi:hypothetical protein KQX54_016392 [Cotesia glomerata]|uniref:Uncharacterized protein n=1 Tax=Cotesia glomerata TaxID=32391 RepID=A0AAV7IRE5_COTGL|nr:hypothetical protein KQX54_016392 [Cotesia glomerata]
MNNEDFVAEEDTRIFSIWFKINEPNADAYRVSNLKTSDYVQLKSNHKKAYEFVKEMVDTGKIFIHPDNIIESIWRSIDDVDYDLLEYPPESYSNSEAEDSSSKTPSSSEKSRSDPNHKLTQPIDSEMTTLSNMHSLSKNSEQDSQKSHTNTNTCANDLSTFNSGNLTTSKNKSKAWEYFTQLLQIRHDANFARAYLKPQEIRQIYAAISIRNTNCSFQLICKLKWRRILFFQLYEKANSYADGGVEAEKLTNSLLYMVAADYMPLCSVENRD